MIRRGLVTVVLALALSAPMSSRAQDGPAEACSALGDPTGLYRSEDGAMESRWAFNFAGETIRPGDPFLAEHTLISRLTDLGPGPHYVLFGVVGPDCETADGQWRALFPPDSAGRRMNGTFTATLAPQLITYGKIEDDNDEPHGWTGLRTAFVSEPAPPRQIVFAVALEHHGPPRQTATLALGDRLSFSGRHSVPATITIPDELRFQARRTDPAALELAPALEFRGRPTTTRNITLADALTLSGRTLNRYTLYPAVPLEFHGKPWGQQTLTLVSPLQFTGQQFGGRSVALGQDLQFSGALPVRRMVNFDRPLTFRHRAITNRNLVLPGLSFRGKPADSRREVRVAGPLVFRGPQWQSPTLVMPVRLVFPGDTAEARAAVITRPVDPVGAAPCGALADVAIERVDFEPLIPQAPDDVTVENIDKLRAAVAPYVRRTAAALDLEAVCMEQRLEAFETLTALSPHDKWARNPAFDGRRFYTQQIAAVRNAAHYLRQVDWELMGIEQVLTDAETFHLFDSVDDPQALKFGLVTDGEDAPRVREATRMKMGDFELMKKHAESDANAMLTQRNRYFHRKIAQRLRYLDAMIVRTTTGLADWTTIENHITRDFMPRVAAAILARIGKLKEEHDKSQPATAMFVVPRGAFDAFFTEFSGLAQTGSPGIGDATFRDYMNNKVWYGDQHAWPNAVVIEQ